MQLRKMVYKQKYTNTLKYNLSLDISNQYALKRMITKALTCSQLLLEQFLKHANEALKDASIKDAFTKSCKECTENVIC